MVLSTGKVAFTIEFDNGDKQNIYFNPNDKKIMERIKAFEGKVNEKIKALDLEKYEKQMQKRMNNKKCVTLLNTSL